MKNGKKYILIADDDQHILDITRILLTSEGYDVLCVSDGKQVIENINEEIDLYLLDVNMPKFNGIQVAEEIRKFFPTPIVFLTAYSSESDKVIGFSVGADDYIVKPFSNIELVMRIRAILRRSESMITKSNQILIQDLILDLDQQTILKNNETIHLTYSEFKILELLSKNKKKIFSLESIYQNIWKEEVIGNDAIMVHIKNIRKKLKDSSKNPIYIKTAWGKGYYIE